MPLERFHEYKFVPDMLRDIERARAIIEEYQAQGFTLTVRQTFYQFVGRALLENNKKSYRRIITVLKRGRKAGLIDWDAIEDRTRDMVKPSAWDSPAEIVRGAASSYREDLWAGQGHRVEVWVEKDALIGVIGPVCEQYRVPYTSARGNTSTSEVYPAGKRIASYLEDGLRPVVLHLADHDPKGVDMTRDLTERLGLYARAPVKVRRIGLNMDQVRRYRPPPNKVKEKDSTTQAYRAQFGTSDCWELDALAPDVIADLIRDAVAPMIDAPSWAKAKRKEDAGRRKLMTLAKQWSGS